MANTRADRGLFNPRLRTGGAPNTEPKKVTAGQVPVYPGQLVKMTGAGTVSLCVDADTTATPDILGVSMSYLSTTSTTLSVSGQNGTIEVVTDLVNTIWDVQLSNATAGQATIGLAFTIIDNNTGDATTKQARGHAEALANGPLHLIDYVTTDGNDTASANPRGTVVFNPDAQHYHGAGV